MDCHDDGPTTVVRADDLELVVVGADVEVEQTLTGRWAGGGPAILAGTREPQSPTSGARG